MDWWIWSTCILTEIWLTQKAVFVEVQLKNKSWAQEYINSLLNCWEKEYSANGLENSLLTTIPEINRNVWIANTEPTPYTAPFLSQIFFGMMAADLGYGALWLGVCMLKSSSFW